jgi:hypothetical protein
MVFKEHVRMCRDDFVYGGIIMLHRAPPCYSEDSHLMEAAVA